MIVVGTAVGVGWPRGDVAPSVPPIALATGGTPTPALPTTALPTPVATPTPEAPHLSRSTPIRLQIPAIGVDTALMELGLLPDGTLEVPPNGFPAGWYNGGPTPGELGPAVIAGHVDWTGPAVFYNLHKLQPNDRVTVTRMDGSVAVFSVSQVQEFPKDAFPTARVYGDIGSAALRLITCGGVFNHQTGHYVDNIIVFATFVAPAG
jgi:hypothetical protein